MIRITPISPPTVTPSVEWGSLAPGEACILHVDCPYIYLKVGKGRDSMAFNKETDSFMALEHENLMLDQLVIPIKTDIHFDLSSVHKEPIE